jgi:hypothetical protein
LNEGKVNKKRSCVATWFSLLSPPQGPSATKCRIVLVTFKSGLKWKKEEREAVWAFLVKPPFTSIRNEMEEIRVPATKKKSAVCKD